MTAHLDPVRGPIQSVVITPFAEPTTEPTRADARRDFPGRWVGGLLGAALSLVAAAIAWILDPAAAETQFLTMSMIGLLGSPVGFVLGRHFLPYARRDGWSSALGVGIGIGWLAPPLGAAVVLLAPFLDPSSSLSFGTTGPLGLLLFWPVAALVSYLAVFITLPVGLAWGVAVRLIPDAVFVALRVPAPFDRLGVRHALLVVVVWLVNVSLLGR